MKAAIQVFKERKEAGDVWQAIDNKQSKHKNQ
jgi:hypothetical protein